MNLFDSSALLALALDEPGADVVEGTLDDLSSQAAVSAAGWSEVAQEVRSHDRNGAAVRAFLLGYDLRVEPVSISDVELAALMWSTSPTLSLADRLCLATAERLDATAWTADRAWGDEGRVRQIR